MIRVAVSGCAGRMGQAVVDAVSAADDMELICGIDPMAPEGLPFQVYDTVETALTACDFEVMVDFTRPDVVEGNLRMALPAGIDCVVGTTGLSADILEDLEHLAPEGTCLFVAPNFTVGAVLMMQFSQMAARFFDESEVIEFHHSKKLDAPSGTAKRTAELIAQARSNASSAPGRETELAGCEGARGADIDGVPVHSVRSMGFVASQEVIFGSMGQTLTIRHDSWDRSSYMPGVLLAIRAVGGQSGLIVGLEKFMF